MSIQAVLGGDIGGTSCKVVVAGLDGRVLGWAQAAGGNIRSHEHAFDNIESAINDAVDGCEDRIDIQAAHLGIAGAGPARWADINSEMQSRWTYDAPLSITSDLETAFAAMSDSGRGVLVISGTGAVSAAFDDYELLARSDGLGWLLGDIGSGTWIGAEVLKKVASALDQRGPDTILIEPVMELLGSLCELPVLDDPRQVLIAGVYSLQPSQYGLFAPLIFDYIDDPMAHDILIRAVSGLCESAVSASAQGSITRGDLVCAGGLLAEGGPLRDQVAQVIHHELPALELTDGGYPPVVGALKLGFKEAGHPMDSQLPHSVVEQTPFR